MHFRDQQQPSTGYHATALHGKSQILRKRALSRFLRRAITGSLLPRFTVSHSYGKKNCTPKTVASNNTIDIVLVSTRQIIICHCHQTGQTSGNIYLSARHHYGAYIQHYCHAYLNNWRHSNERTEENHRSRNHTGIY